MLKPIKEDYEYSRRLNQGLYDYSEKSHNPDQEETSNPLRTYLKDECSRTDQPVSYMLEEKNKFTL